MDAGNDHLYPPGLSGPIRSPTPSLSHERTPSAATDAGYGGYENERFLARTPSPTLSENELIRRKGTGGIDRENWRKYFTRKYLVNWIVIIVVLTITILIAVFNDKIIEAIEPTGQKIKEMPAGFLIPIAIMIVLSFPPLFGAEIIHILCGVIWGLWAGFGIVAAGTILGEIANYFVFKYMCTARAQKYEQKNLQYGVLAKVVRESGFAVLVMCRLSVLPAHFTTVLFSLAGVGFFSFFAAAVISLVKMFASVYIGVASRAKADGTVDKKTKIINIAIIAATVVITIVAMRYINAKVDAAKPSFVYARRKARQHQPTGAPGGGEGFVVAAPTPGQAGKKGYGRVLTQEDDGAHEPLYTGYPKEGGPYAPPAMPQPYSHGGV